MGVRGFRLLLVNTRAVPATRISGLVYLTMQFYYVFGLLALALALPVVFARAASSRSNTA
jgi:hypothetical protein